MSAPGRVAAFVFSRQALALICIVLLGLALWFGGPYLGFGESRPLEPVEPRLVITTLLLAFLLFWLLHWPLSMIAAAALCLAIWYFGPGIAFGEARIFEPEWVRLLLIGLIVFFYALYLLYRLWQAVRVNDDLLQKILHPRFGQPDSIAKERIDEIESVFKESLARLKSLRSDVGVVRSFFQRAHYIYDLPWYMLIGSPGSGKTTIILNSGLKFPLSGGAGEPDGKYSNGRGVFAASRSSGITGSGGTRNCTWWLSNEAVLLDTAGRYATHETDKAADSAEWLGFLKLLRVHRPRSPINGALMTISVEELLGKSREEILSHAVCLRGRLEEVRANLGVSFPVYVTVTKMDLVKGFQGYFQNLSPDGRNKIWGFTLSRDFCGDVKKVCASEMERLVKNLGKALPKRLHEEIDIAERRALYCLPGEMDELGHSLLMLLEHSFPESRYGEPMCNMLRGVYFTSALQTSRNISFGGGTLAAVLRGNFAAGKTANPQEGNGRDGVFLGNKSYFIRDLLQKVVFPEKHLAKPNRIWLVRWRIMRLVSHLFMIASAATLGYALWASHEANRRLLDAAEKEFVSIRQKLVLIEKENREDLIAPLLAQACSYDKFEGIDRQNPPLAWRFGLYSGEQALKDSAAVCRRLQDLLLVPRATSRLEQALAPAGASQPSDKAKKRSAAVPDRMPAYDALRVYLRLFKEGKYDAADILRWFTEDIRRNGSENFFAGSRLYQELERCLYRPGGVNLPPNSANAGLIAATRALLGSIPAAERVYDRAKAHMSPNAPDDFSISRAAGSGAARLFRRKSGQPLESGVPGLFTRSGYHDLFNAQLSKYAASALDEDGWVMGAEVSRSPSSDPIREIRRLYLQEYAARWEEFLADIYPVYGNTLASMASSINEMAGPGSPLPVLARAVVRETTLSGGPGEAALDKLAEKAAGKAGGAGKAASGFRPESLREMELVDMRFAALREAVYGSVDPKVLGKERENPGPRLEAMLAKLRELAACLKEAQTVRDTGAEAPPEGPAMPSEAEAELLPQFLKNVMRDLVRDGTTKASAAQGGALGRLAQSSVGDACRGGIAGHYPFNRKGADVDPAKFAAFFGPGGVVDSFFQKNLAPYVDTSSSPWRYKRALPGAPDLKPFESAALIREAFFGGEGGKGGIKFTVQPRELDNRINNMSIIVDGDKRVYEHGPIVPLELSVPSAKAPGSVEITISPRPRGTPDFRTVGAFAGMRILEKGKIEETGDPAHFFVHYDWDERSVVLEVSAPENNPLLSDLFSSFKCPETSRDFGARMLR